MPDQPEESGTVVGAIEKKPKLGFWLMPDNTNPGMLEDFCADLADRESFEFADQCVTEAQERSLTNFNDIHRSKAVIHTYLAWQDEPGQPLGQAITTHSLKPETYIAQSFTGWLRTLFG